MNTAVAKSQPTVGLRHILGRYPLTIFFLLAYALSWWSIPFGGQIPHGPAVAAVLVLALTEGRRGLAALWRQFTHWRVAWYWYLAAPGIVVGYHLVALILNLLRDATLLESAALDGGRVLLALLPLLVLGGQWEELGWCGYALPRLQQRFAQLAYGPLIASLILGVLRGVWHLPLFAVGLIPWYDVVFLSLAMQFIASWLYNRTRGSLPVVMFFHLASNVAGVIMPLLFTGADLTAHSRLFVALACLCALVVVGVAGPALGVRQQPPFEGKVAEPLPQARKGKRRLGWGKRLLTWFLGVVMALAGAGVVYQQIGTALDRRFYGPPGQLVNVGGYKLHLHCLGQGSPTVILDHVGATNSAQWALIQPQVATQTRVCAYDRAGFGWSEPGPGPRDAAHNAQELHTLLANAGIEGPYLFVGHSFGANVARIYAATYPDEITGLVLVDPGLLSGRPEVPAEVAAQWETQEDGFMQIAPWLARFGIIRLAGALGALPGHGDLPSPQAEAFDAWQRTNQFYVTLKAQYRAMGATSAQVLAAEATLGDMPLIVLSAAQPEQNRSRKVWTSVNAGLAARSANGVHTVVPGSDHMSLALRREDAQVTTSAILEIVEAVRTERPLSWEGSR